MKNKTKRPYFAVIRKSKNGIVKIREYDRMQYSDDNTHKRRGGRKKKEIEKNEYGTIQKRSLASTRNKLIELVNNNEDSFISFITLTFADAKYEDIELAYKEFKKWIRKIKYILQKDNKQLKYLCVPEIQKKRAEKTGYYVVHFHLLTNIELGSSIIPKRNPKVIMGENYKGYTTIEYYDLLKWDKGYSIAIAIYKNNEGFDLSLYLLKYLYKDLDDRFFGRQKILHSNNLDKDSIIYVSFDYEYLDSIRCELSGNIKEKYFNRFDIAHQVHSGDKKANFRERYTDEIYKTDIY